MHFRKKATVPRKDCLSLEQKTYSARGTARGIHFLKPQKNAGSCTTKNQFEASLLAQVDTDTGSWD